MEPHHRRCYMPVAPLLWRPVSSPCMHAGVLVGPGRERWGIGCRRRRELPDPRSGRGPHPRDGRRARMPGRLDPSSAAVDLEVDEAAGKAHRPSRPGPRRGARAAAGLRPLPGPFLPEHCPSFTTRAAQRGHQIPPFILDTLFPLDTFIVLFLFNKSLSEAWRHTHCVCRSLLPSHWWRNAGRRSLDSAVGQHRWRHPLSLAEIRENPHWDGGTTETASQPPKG